MENSRFSKIYFSGSQAQIFVNDNHIAEAVTVEGVLDVNQIPVYGYFSHHFDGMAVGKVIATGSITINYVFDGYLYALILKAESMKSSASDPSNPIPPKAAVEKKDYETFNYSDAEIKELKKQWWGANGSVNKGDSNKIRPEFMRPIKIDIKDFRTGSIRSDLPNADNYESKTFKNVFLNKYVTIRRTDGSPVQESYSFIAQTFI